MRNENKLYNFLKGGCSFFYRGIFSSLSNEMSPAFYSSATIAPTASCATMKKKSPSTEVIPKRSLDNILHYLLLQQIKNEKQFSSIQQKRSAHFLFLFYKNFQFAKRLKLTKRLSPTKKLKDTALSLLQTQYAKKPKNPE